MYFGGIVYTYLIYVMPAIILSFIASMMVKSRFAHYDKVQSHRNITGAQAAEILLRANNITDVKIAHVGGELTDNYNPSTKILNLSDSTYSSTSIAAIGVAAHETGHAIQHKVGYKPLALRSTLVPVANIGSQFGPLLAVLGILFGAAVLFYLITLPVEFNASYRALQILKNTGTLEGEEISGVRKVLWAAAMTYVASALVAIGNLLRLLVLSNNRRNRR